MQKLNFPGTHWRGMALIGAPKKPCICNKEEFRKTDKKSILYLRHSKDTKKKTLSMERKWSS